MNERLARLRLLQLASPSLPVGAYSYSQGLEAAIEADIVRDAPSAADWIGDVLALSVAGFEAPVFLRLTAAWLARDSELAWRWNEELVASRETAELRAETLQMGHSLRALLRELSIDASRLDAFDEIAYATAFSFACHAWEIAPAEALEAYLFAWIENQALAALKAVPLGQTAVQRMVLGIAARIPGIVEHAACVRDEDLSNLAPGLAILSSRHETQYSRLFRS
jgi:urease accessory protein